MKLPERDDWLAAGRVEDTIRAITGRLMVFGAMLALLLCFAHWAVVQANLRQPPRLDGARFLVASALFVTATAWWLHALFARFRRPL